VDDLKHKDFICLAPLSHATVISVRLRPRVIGRFRQAAPFMRFLCKALDLRC